MDALLFLILKFVIAKIKIGDYIPLNHSWYLGPNNGTGAAFSFTALMIPIIHNTTTKINPKMETIHPKIGITPTIPNANPVSMMPKLCLI